MIATWLTATALAGYDDVLADAIDKYKPGLTVADAPETYHVRYQLLSLQQVDVRTSMGSLVSESTSPFHALGVEIRVGTPTFDNTGFGGWQNGTVRASLPAELTEGALRNELWRTTDRAYKEAVEQYARKESQFEAPADWPGDYTLTGATKADEGEARAEQSSDRLRALALRMGAELATPEALRAEVHVGHEAGSLWTVDSEGTRVHTPVDETSIRVLLQIRAEDGSLLTDQRLFTARGVDHLPDDLELVAAVQHMRDDLLATARAPAWSEEYVGPVVFEQSAATDLYRYLLVSQLEGTPAEIPFDSFFGELGSSTDPVRVGRRVLPPGWRVVDDPSSVPSHPGSYTYDHEGTKTRSIELVEDGIVRTLAMSRTPRRGLTETNGHGRGMVGDRVSGRLSLYTVTPARTLSDARMSKEAARAARAYDRDWWVVVRRLQEPAVLGYETDTWFDVGATPLPPPVQVVKHWVDGREEVFRGARLSGVQRWLLRDIVAAGHSVETDYLAPLTPGDWGGMRPTEGVVSRARGPVVLVGEVELVPDPGDPMDVPVIEAPTPVVTGIGSTGGLGEQ